MNKPVVIDLCCGLGGWSKGFIAEGYEAIGFDVERHEYWVKCEACDGTGNFYRHDEDGDFLPCDCFEEYGGHRAGTVLKKYPGHLILRDVLTLNGYDLRAANPSVIVASPPCQKYSYMAMPWGLSKREIRWQEWERTSPFGDFRLNAIFDACFRIARECGVPIIAENVKGAQPWVGGTAWHYGSYYLWGDVPALMPLTTHRKVPGFNFHQHEKTGKGGSFQSASVKQAGLSGEAWFNEGAAALSSKSAGRKQASAEIAEIPMELSQWIARCFKP